MARGSGWAMSGALMLLAFSPLAGSEWGHGVRALFNDDVSRHHSRTATAVGFSLVVVTALVLFLLPVSATLAARAAIYLIVTPALFGALLTFACLEWWVQHDG